MDHKCDFIMGTHTCNLMNSDPSGLCSIHRDMPGIRLRDVLQGPESGCRCPSIMAKDKTRHFRECPLREKYPDPPPR